MLMYVAYNLNDTFYYLMDKVNVKPIDSWLWLTQLNEDVQDFYHSGYTRFVIKCKTVRVNLPQTFDHIF